MKENKIVNQRLKEAASDEPTFGQVRQQQSAKKQLIASLTVDEKRIMLAKYDAEVNMEVGVEESTLYDWFMDGLPGWAKVSEEEVLNGWEDAFGATGQNQFSDEQLLHYIEDFLGKTATGGPSEPDPFEHDSVHGRKANE